MVFVIVTPSKRIEVIKMSLNKSEREVIKQKYGGRCAYCGKELGNKWHVDHIEPVKRNISNDYKMDHPELDNLDNMNPACIPCNLFKSSCSIELFRERIADQVNVTRRASRSFRTAEDFGLVTITNSPVAFWFEKYSK